jgi:hypothetical protein
MIWSTHSYAENNYFLTGLGAHLYGVSRAEVLRQLDIAAAAKVKAIRIDFPWRVLERQPGVYQFPPLWDFIVDSARSRGIEPLLILCYGNKLYDNGDKPVSAPAVLGFANYAGAVAAHFRDKVRFYEIWNEWNGSQGNTSIGRAEDYIKLITATYPVIKNAVPNSTVLVGATSAQSYQALIGLRGNDNQQRTAFGFFDKLLDLGMMNHGDALSIHPYTFSFPPSSGVFNNGEGYYKFVTAIIDRLKEKAPHKSNRVFVTEVGWPTSSTPRPSFVSQTEQADNLTQSLILSRTIPGIEGVFIYELKNGGNDPLDREMNFGVTELDGSPKPAYRSLQQIMSLTGQLARPAIMISRAGDSFRLITTKDKTGSNNVSFLWTKQRGNLAARITCEKKDTKVTLIKLGDIDQTIACNTSVSFSSSPIAIVGPGVTITTTSM